MTMPRAGDGSNAPVAQVNDILAKHFADEEPVETPQEESVETQHEETPEDPALEAQTPEEELEAAEEEATPGEEEGDELKTIADLAEALELDPSTLYDLQYAMPDGMEPVTLSELKDSYIKQARGGGAEDGIDPNAKAAFEQEKQAFDQQKQYVQQQINAQAQMPQELRAIEAQLFNIGMAYNNTDWAKLEEVDPGDAVLQRQKLAEHRQKLLYQQQQIQGTLMQQQQAGQQEFARQQIEVLETKHPEWKGKPEAVTEAWGVITSHLKDYGLTDADMKAIPDGRVFNLLYDAAVKAKGITTEKVKGKKLTRKSAPVLRAGAVRRAIKGNRSKLDNVIKRGAESTDIRDKVSAVSALLSS